MISTYAEPFLAFCKDLHIAGDDVHLYKGAQTFGCTLESRWNAGSTVPELPGWWEIENVYFLAGVKPGLEKRAADMDVRHRGMFTLDFDIRKELEKKGLTTGEEEFGLATTSIIEALEPHPIYGKFRYIVLSGNGMHVHYFGTPCVVEKEKWVQGMKDVFDEVSKVTPIPPDFGCGNAGRIMRMPGSWNVKDPANPKPVEIVAWMPQADVGPLEWVQERGALRIARLEAKQEQERQEFVERTGGEGSGLIALINSIPIEQVVKQLTGCTVRAKKKDGGLRFADEKGEERGFFKHHAYNIIVHEGTGLFPAPEGKGYNCLGLAKAVLQVDTHTAIQWFAERSGPIRDLQAKEREEWIRENAASETLLYEEKISSLPQ